MSPKKCAGNRMAQRPTCQSLRGSTSLDYTHVRAGTLSGRKFGGGGGSGPPFERAPRSSDPTLGASSDGSHTTCPAGPAAVPSCPPRRPRLPRLSFPVQGSAPRSLCLCGLVSWPCVYNNSHHFGSLLIAPSLFLPSILRVDPVAVRACSIGGESPG